MKDLENRTNCVSNREERTVNDCTVNIKIFYLYKILLNTTVRGPILVTYMTNFCKMPLSEIYFCEACCVALLVLLQIPTGIIADKWGRTKTIRVGCLILVSELCCFSLATDHILVWVGNALWAIGVSFISGADCALIYDSLKQTIKDEKKLEEKYREIEGKSSAGFYIITAGLCLISGYIAEINMRLPSIIDTLTMVATFIIATKFVEPKIHSDSKASASLDFWLHAKESVLYVLRKGHILWIVSFIVLIGVTSKLWFFTYNPYFELVGLDLKYFGFVFCLLNITAGFSSYFANQISERLSGKKGIIVSIGCVTLPMIVMGLVISKWSILLVLFQNLVRGYLGPFVSNMLNKRIESSNRATVLSVKSMIHQAVEVICMAMFAGLIASANLGIAITLLGIISSSIGIVLTAYYVKIFVVKRATISNPNYYRSTVSTLGIKKLHFNLCSFPFTPHFSYYETSYESFLTQYL